METVFDHNPTPAEIDDCGFNRPFSLSIRHGLDFPDPLTADGYRSVITTEAAAFDLYLLFDSRGEVAKAATYAAIVPDQVAQYELGFDYRVRAS